MRNEFRNKISFEWKTPALWALILTVALAIRILFLYLNPVLPRDAVLYCRLMEIFHHDGTSALLPFWETLNRHETFWIPPLSLYILKLPMYLGLTANTSGIIISLLSGISLVFCALLIGRELFPHGRWYLWGAAFAAVHPRLVELSTQTTRDGLYLAASGWVMYLFLRLLKKEKVWLAVPMILLLWPAAFMIRYEALEIFVCIVFFCLISGKKNGMPKVLLIFCVGLIVSCLCFSLLSPIVKDYFIHQVPARLILYSSGQSGGNYAQILFQKIPQGLFWPFCVSGSLGLFLLFWKHRSNRKACCFSGMVLFMWLWRIWFQINSSRYVNNMILPYLMLSVYVLFYLHESKKRIRCERLLSIIAGLILVCAGIGKTLHYNPYADSLLKICSCITAQKNDVQIFTNKEQSRLAYLTHKDVQIFTADDLTLPDKDNANYLAIWYHPAKIITPDDCKIQQKIMNAGCKELFNSFTNRKQKTIVTVYASESVPINKTVTFNF